MVQLFYFILGMDFIPHISISKFDYPLPEEKIAQFPLPQRDKSKLLIFNNGTLAETIFKNVAEYLPPNSLLIRNETKVIRARLLFRKETGAVVELFFLEPVKPVSELHLAFNQKSGVIWKCLIGNSKRWKSGRLLKKLVDKGKTINLNAERLEQFADYSVIRLEWDSSSHSLSEIFLLAGITPLPPYLNREAIESDAERYQTIYANTEGSVAAPTAGLHFTENVLQSLKNRNIITEEVTLHVGAGTFKPVNEENIRNHQMHAENIIIQHRTIKRILENINDPIIAVGTTTIRTIESLYWFGVKLLVDGIFSSVIHIKQWDPYGSVYNCNISSEESFQAILKLMNENNMAEITGRTELMIVPGYRFRVSNVLITNFHMPRSTLLLLVSAFIGNDWKEVYNYALSNDFRFLSYGDSCLFYLKNE
jgi:S-adenosylmethionine:tRNA ribosyltransferase-isomerase